jgi:hypothetical protein
VAGLVLLSGYYFWTLRPDVLLVMAGALPVLGDVLRYTISPLLGWLQMPLLKWAMFSPARVPARFQAEYSPAMALRPSQIRATSVDGALMIPGAAALRRDYKELTLPVVIVAGDGDKIVFKQSVRAAAGQHSGQRAADCQRRRAHGLRVIRFSTPEPPRPPRADVRRSVRSLRPLCIRGAGSRLTRYYGRRRALQARDRHGCVPDLHGS